MLVQNGVIIGIISFAGYSYMWEEYVFYLLNVPTVFDIKFAYTARVSESSINHYTMTLVCPD